MRAITRGDRHVRVDHSSGLPASWQRKRGEDGAQGSPAHERAALPSERCHGHVGWCCTVTLSGAKPETYPPASGGGPCPRAASLSRLSERRLCVSPPWIARTSARSAP